MHSLPGDLTTLVQTALALEGEDRRRAAGRINDWLRIRHHVATQVERDEVLMWMDHPGFAELSDHDARHCRAEAAELLLSLGYPSALHVSPEALLAARRQRVTPVLGAAVLPSWVGRIGLPLAFLPMGAMPFVCPEQPHSCTSHGYRFDFVGVAVVLGLARWVFSFPARATIVTHLLSVATLIATAFAAVGAAAANEHAMLALCAIAAACVVAMSLPRLKSFMRLG